MLREKYTGPLPTLGQDKALGISKLRIYCERLSCAHSGVIDIDRLGLPDEVAVIHIPRYRRFVCSRCGSRKVCVRSELPPAFGTPGWKLE